MRGLGGQGSHDQTKPWGFGQEAPLTAEYQAVLEASLADQAAGGLGNFPTARCYPAGMPHMMMAFGPQEYVITPETTYILIDWDDHNRRIYTDGRDWPAALEPTFSGYSIGRWIDEDGDGRYDVLEVETRGPFKGPRAYDGAGLPLHFDDQSIFKERIHLDKADPNVLHDEMTVIDHALTRPWTVDKRYLRNPEPAPDVARILLRREQRPDRHRQAELFPRRGRLPDARQGRSAAAGSAIFQATAEMNMAAGGEVKLRRLAPLATWFGALEPVAGSEGGILRLAAATASSLLATQQDIVVLHGDMHHGNVLDFGARGWLAIDPKGLVGDRCFDYANMFCNPDHEARDHAGPSRPPGRGGRRGCTTGAQPAAGLDHRLGRSVGSLRS